MLETGGIDFTVQDIVDRSGLSLRSFYKHFGGKDELLLALFEELLQDFASELRREVEVFDDPVDQLRAYVRGFAGRAELSGEHGGRALGTYHVRMMAIRKDDFAGALRPQIDVLREIVAAGVDSGRFRTDLEVDAITGLLTITLMSAAQMAVLDVHLTGAALTWEHLWAWCAVAVGVDPEPARPATAKRAARTGIAPLGQGGEQARRPPRRVRLADRRPSDNVILIH